MTISGFKSVPRLVFSVFVLALLPAAGTLAQQADMDTLFEALQAEGRSVEEVILTLVENENELDNVAAFTVSNAGGIGLSVAYAQTAVCLAPTEPAAQTVGQIAVDSAQEDARNAVQAGVVSALSNYAEGTCRELLDQRNNDSQAFAAPSEGGPAAPGSAGGDPPEIDVEEPPASDSQ